MRRSFTDSRSIDPVAGGNWGLTPISVVAIAAAILLALALLPPVAEPQRFQTLADDRSFFGIANFVNVVSNVPFLIVGVWGLRFVARNAAKGQVFARPSERWAYVVCFLALALTAFGSSYYHLDVDSGRLFWDRLPIACGFMGLFAAVIAGRIEDLQVVAEGNSVAWCRPGRGGSHVIFSAPGVREIVSVPSKRPIKPVYIRQVVALIDAAARLNTEREDNASKA